MKKKIIANRVVMFLLVWMWGIMIYAFILFPETKFATEMIGATFMLIVATYLIIQEYRAEKR